MGANKGARGSWWWVLTALTALNKNSHAQRHVVSPLHSMRCVRTTKKRKRKKEKKIRAQSFRFLTGGFGFPPCYSFCPLMYCSWSDKAKPQVMHQTHSDWFWYLNKHLAGMLHVTPALPESSVASPGAQCTCLACSPVFPAGIALLCMHKLLYICLFHVCLFAEGKNSSNTIVYGFLCEAPATIRLCTLAPAFWYYGISYKFT